MYMYVSRRPHPAAAARRSPRAGVSPRAAAARGDGSAPVGRNIRNRGPAIKNRRAIDRRPRTGHST
eukprot:scaffold106305_cov70-Phaeocystis_antarctica.AAC.3